MAHDFIFKPGLWVGEGRVTFSASPERLRFYTKWTIEKEIEKTVTSQQRVEMEGGGSNVYNTFILSDMTPVSFFINNFINVQ